VIKILADRQKFRIRLFFEGLRIGICTGVIVAALRFLLDETDILRPLWFQNFNAGKFFVTLTILILIAKFLDWAINFDKQIAGSGIPQIKEMLQGRASMYKPLRLILVKFTAVILAIGAGMSLGRAGIAVQFGACVGNFFKNKSEILLTAGAAAGLAAVFNAPLAGVIFCIEELRKKFTPEILIATLTASVSASAVVKLVFGVRPIFETITAQPLTVPEILKVSTLEIFADSSIAPLKIFACFVMLGIFSGIIGALFTKSMILSLNLYEKWQISRVKKFLIPLILILPIGLNLPQILGCGNVLVDELLNREFNFEMAVELFFGNWLFTLICFGTGAPGGVFLPVLTLGALGGDIFAEIGASLGIFSTYWATLLIVFGMAAFFAAVIKAPVTGCLLIMETTGQFAYLLTLTIVSGAAFMASDICGGKPIFSALINRRCKH
jgi:H+/Cl- antiporter ClcA